jgi:hypothetical protein
MCLAAATPTSHAISANVYTQRRQEELAAWPFLKSPYMVALCLYGGVVLTYRALTFENLWKDLVYTALTQACAILKSQHIVRL